MDTQAAVAVPQAEPTATGTWAPGLLPMLACTTLMVFFMFFSSVVADLLVPGKPEMGAVFAFVGLVASGSLSHVYYKRARAALDNDATLHGRWLVENSWWLVPVAGLALPMAGIIAAVRYL
ncbi:MAG: hypothetical protein QOJ26_643 [Thermoplasmata archaeon]|jgi:hypothetical protein|nr:hypothetical protein [Thermoplasmata archaeon]